MANGRETWVQPKLEPEGRDRGQGGAGQANWVREGLVCPPGASPWPGRAS